MSIVNSVSFQSRARLLGAVPLLGRRFFEPSHRAAGGAIRSAGAIERLTFVRRVRAIGGAILELFKVDADVRMVAARHLGLGVAPGR